MPNGLTQQKLHFLNHFAEIHVRQCTCNTLVQDIAFFKGFSTSSCECYIFFEDGGRAECEQAEQADGSKTEAQESQS